MFSNHKNLIEVLKLSSLLNQPLSGKQKTNIYFSKKLSTLNFSDAGSALFLTPYIESGDIETARELARVVEPLDGLDAGDVVESYAGFFTVTKATDSNMFFWFIPATVS